MNRLLLVSQRPLEYGGTGIGRWRYLPEALSFMGWEVSTVTARPNPSGDEYATDRTRMRLHATRATAMTMARRVMAPVVQPLGIQPEALAPSAAWVVTGRSRIRRAIAEFEPDIIWATGPPPASYFVLAGLRDAIRVPLVCELRDNWAGNPYYDAGGSVLRRIEDWGLRKASAVVVVTPPMVDVMERLHPSLRGRLHLVPNGFDESVIDRRPPRASREGRKLIAIHAGALQGYPGRTIEPVLEALRRPELATRYSLELIGPGSPPDARGLDVHIQSPIPWDEAIEAQARADIGVVLHSDDATALGTKVFELLALGKPVLALVEERNALHRFLVDLEQGVGCARHDDVDAIAAALTRLADDPPPPVPRDRLLPWTRGHATAQVAELLGALLS